MLRDSACVPEFPWRKRARNRGKLTLDTVLQFMDHAGQGFKTLTADIEHIKYTAVVKDTSTETGKIWVRKDSRCASIS